MGPIFRTFSFMGEVLGMVRQNPMLLAPLLLNLAIAVPVNIAFAIAMVLAPVEYQGLLSTVMMLFGLTALYFIDYFCGGLTASMVYDQVTTGKASLGPAVGRTLKASPGILIFAVVSAILDFLTQLASQRQGVMRIVGPILLGILRMIWTTATYVIMPALVVEQQGFFAALKRSKALMENDPTQIGVGVVAIGLISWLLGMVSIVLAYASFNVLAGIHMALGMLAFYTFVNVFWSVSGYIKGVYYTCYYLWAVECERQNSASPQLAPAPLRNVIGGVEAGAW
jgi:hypothetical protein